MIRNKDWRKYHGALIPSFPPHLEINESYSSVQSFLKKNNIIFARWISNFDCNLVTPFWYIINDKSMSLEDYSSNTRNQIKKGLKLYTIRKIDKEVILDNGYEIYSHVYKSYNTIFRIKDKKEFIKELLDGEWDFWGVYKNNVLIGFSQNKLKDKSCDYSTIKILPKHLKEYAFYALMFKMNYYYLFENNFKYVTNGTRSIAHKSNIQKLLINKFRFRKAYCRLQICYHPIINIIVRLLFPFRRIFKHLQFNFFLKIYVVLKLEAIRRLSDNIFNNSLHSKSQLILSNGNFKSGSTWVTAIIKQMLNNENYDFPEGYQNPKYNNWINIFRISNFISSSFFKQKNYWLSKSHIFNQSILSKIIIYQNNIKVIHIHRDLKDVLVSHFHHLRNSRKYNKEFKSYFYSWGIYKAIQYLYYNKLWLDGPCLTLKYEDLKNNNHQAIKMIAEYLNISLSDEEIKVIQKETEINRLRSNSKINKLNEQEWFYRKGIIGDWKNYFDDQMLLELKHIESERITLFKRMIYFIKFTSRIRFKFFLYRFIPFMYKTFDKRF